MKTIYKYHIKMPWTDILSYKNAKFLSVQVQNGMIFVWAEIDDTEEKKAYRIKTFGTGWDLGDISEYQYIGTFQLEDGNLIFHSYITKG